MSPFCSAARSALLGIALSASTLSCAGSWEFDDFGTTPTPATGASDVVVNGRALPEHEVRSLEATYGTAPLPGRWWYDATSGLYGPEGGSAAGFMHPGHACAPLQANASNGRSGVYVNGRELAADEAHFYASLARSPVQPGRYWFDGQGNVGAEGSPWPLGNFYTALQGGGGAGGGSTSSGGDNFWSTRFSAGNHNDQGQGYVSVPGYGPVGYGF